MRAEAGRPGLQMPSDLSVRPRLRCCAGAGHAQGSDVLCPVLPRLRTLVCAPASAAEVPAFGCPAPAPREPTGPRKDHDDRLDALRDLRPGAAPQPRRARATPGGARGLRVARSDKGTSSRVMRRRVPYAAVRAVAVDQ